VAYPYRAQASIDPAMPETRATFRPKHRSVIY